MSDLILVPCPVCDCGWRSDECVECENTGWILERGAPIELADLERMAPWADDFETVASFDLSIRAGRPLESGEVDGIH